MPTMRSWLLLCAALPAEPHAFWLTLGEEKTFVRFSESPITTTLPGFDPGLANRTGVFVAIKPATAVSQLAFTMGTEGGFHNLVAPTPSSLRDPAAVAMVEGEGLKGMYYAAAPAHDAFGRLLTAMLLAAGSRSSRTP